MIYIEKFILMLFISMVIWFVAINVYEYKDIIYNMLLATSGIIFLILILKEFQPIKKLLLNIIKLPLSFINRLLTDESKEIRNEENKTSILCDEIYKKIDNKKIEPIKNIIKAHQSKEFFSMALVGEWGIGKSSYLYNLGKELQKDDYKVIHINVWELENLSNVLKEIEKEFDNILFNNSILLWVNKLFYSIVGKDYFSIASKYFIKSGISLDIGLTPTLNEAKKHYNSLLNKTVSKKIILCIDEVDRLDNKNDILDVFKVIRYLTSFDSVFTITAIDMNQLEDKLDNIEYVHKIFNLKYILPKHTKSELAKFLKEDIYEELKEFVNKKDFDKLLNTKEINTNQTIVSIFNNYREIKNSFNDTYLMIKTLNSYDRGWNEYISWKFIFILSIIKSTNFKLYIKIMEDDNLITIVNNLNNIEDMKEKLSEKDTSFKDIFKKSQQDFDKNILVPISILYYMRFSEIKHFITQYLYVYKHYKVYDFLITNTQYKEIITNVNSIDDTLDDIIREEKTEFLLNLIKIISNDTANQSKILKKIIEIIQKNEDINVRKIILEIVEENMINKKNEEIFSTLIRKNQSISFELMNKLLEQFKNSSKRKSMDTNIIISLLKLYLKNIDETMQLKSLSLLNNHIDINFQDEIGYDLREIFYNSYNGSKYEKKMIEYLLLSIYLEKLNEMFKKLNINRDEVIDDNNIYTIYTSDEDEPFQKVLKGKKLKSEIK